MTIVDYSNLMFLGVTVALAWPLPIKPFYPGSDFEYQHYGDESPHGESSHDMNKNATAATTNSNSSAPAMPPSIGTDKQAMMEVLRKHYEKFGQRTKTNSNVAGMNYASNYNSISAEGNKNNHYYSDGPHYASPMAPFGPKVVPSGLTSADRREDVFNVRPPLSPSYHPNADDRNSNHYEQFANYLLESYFEPWSRASWDLGRNGLVRFGELISNSLYLCDFPAPRLRRRRRRPPNSQNGRKSQRRRRNFT